MFNKSLKYSYTDRKNIAAKRRGVIFAVLIFFVIYLLITNFFFSMRVLENTSMQPSLNYGDRFVFLSFGIKKIIPYPPLAEALPVRRGNIVLIDRNVAQESMVKAALNKLIRFFTASKLRLPGMEDQLFIKRVIALPGDTVSMNNYVLRIQPVDEKYTFTEFELSDKHYEVHIPNVPALWDESIPFSGSMEEKVLGADEFFVLSDDRSNTNDSRTWGTVPGAMITGRGLFRYWPLNRIGFP
jgi:signal peptidase I